MAKVKIKGAAVAGKGGKGGVKKAAMKKAGVKKAAVKKAAAKGKGGAKTGVDEVPVIRGEAAARRYLEQVRWPDGVWCPRCGGEQMWEIAERGQRECQRCAYQFSVTAGTAFAGSHVALEKWLKCVKLQVKEDKGLSARRVGEELGVTYKTAWYLCHRVRAAMGAAAGRKLAAHEERPAARGAALLDEGVKAAWITISDKHKAKYVGEAKFRHRYADAGVRFRKVVEELLGGEAVGYGELTGE